MSGSIGCRIVATLCFLTMSAASMDACASGWAPFQRGDNIVVEQGGTTSVLSNGATSVLDNDFDIENDPLTAELDGDVKHGTLIFNTDGTFVYQHNGESRKDDQFFYRAFDGTGYSRRARVRIAILAPKNSAPFSIGSPPDQEGIENVFFELALAEFFADLDEGDTLRFTAAGLPGSRSLTIDPDSGILSGTPIAADSRDNAYIVTITATDSGGLSASIEFQLIIYADDRTDLAVTVGLNVNPVTVGDSAQWNIVVENLGPSDLDEGELVARWSTSGPKLSLSVPQECTISANDSSDPSIRCSLNGLGTGTGKTFTVQGMQDGDGDNSLIAIAVSDDPIVGNNSALIGSQVVAAFSEGPTQVLSATGSDVAAGDLNGDGHQDLVVTTDQTIVFINDGNRKLRTPGTSLGPDSGGTAVVTLDWNGDGIVDVAVLGMSAQTGRIYLNDGSGEFPQSIDLNYRNSAAVFAAVAADFAQDGFVDLVVTGAAGSKLFRSTGKSGFSLTSLPAGPGIDVSIADVNNDSFADILIVESADRSVKVLRNSGDGRNFASQRLQRGSVAGVTGADLNGNGRVDLLLAVDGGDLTLPESRILYQRSDGTYPDGETIGASSLNKMLAGDVDGDSLMDIIALNDAGVHQLYRGNAGGGFVLQAEQIVSAGMRQGILLDFNNDQSLDLIMAGPDSNVVEIHANNGIGSLGLGDRIAPVITLNGEATVAVAAGAGYEDPGATATDDIDGDLSGSVTTTGSFDTSSVGSYTLAYSVSDRAGNLGTATRVINVGLNQGVGGGGGGAVTPAFLFLQMLLLIFLLAGRHRSRTGYLWRWTKTPHHSR
jgi:hypothetical protein